MLFFFWVQRFLPVAVVAGDLPPRLPAVRAGVTPVAEVTVVRCLKP